MCVRALCVRVCTCVLARVCTRIDSEKGDRLPWQGGSGHGERKSEEIDSLCF